ncbi:dihydroorotate dehydrogenase electron transfer subunit [Streptococcus sp. H31]|uniref:dihydroorotate dehydrogenase electron transfer subunit n=1 Tax=Streptococcus huangxiaojuni TaxID=3237239 RepID=UPI0034A465EA
MSAEVQGRTLILKEDMAVISQREIASGIFEMKLSGDMVDDMKAGQFLHLRVPDPSKLLRRPISISQIDKKSKTATIIYRVEREGTAILSQLSAGDTLDVMGPQGNGFDLSVVAAGQKVLLIGGGIGVPPLVETAKQLASKGAEIVSVLGFSSQKAIILERELNRYGKVYITTDDGSYGIKGYVSTVIDSMSETFAAVYACGAPGMLKYVDQKFAQHPHAYLSLEARMACGMGACYACVVHLKNQTEAANKRVCEDGPVFAIGQIEF